MLEKIDTSATYAVRISRRWALVPEDMRRPRATRKGEAPSAAAGSAFLRFRVRRDP